MSDLISEKQNLQNLVADVRRMIDESKRQAATVFSSLLTMLYWRIGSLIW